MTTKAPADRDRACRPLARLRRRADFIRASKTGARHSGRLFTVQMARQPDVDAGEGEASASPPRFGVTVTRKVGNAVGRNRIRRRLKEALRISDAAGAQTGRDYVFVARREALTAPFADLLTQMADSFAQLDRSAARARRKQKDRLPAP